MNENELYIVLKYYNAYEQYGGYFHSVHKTRKEAENSVSHIGRYMPKNKYELWDQEWYEIEKVKVGTIYKFTDNGLKENK